MDSGKDTKSSGEPQATHHSQASHAEYEALNVVTLHNDTLSHPGVHGPACDNCIRDYENEPGLVCKYEYAAGLPCDRCQAKGYTTCCKVSLIDHNGQPRRDRQPIIDLQHMAAEVNRLNTAGEPVPQALKEKFHLLQFSVSTLVKTIVDTASKGRHLRRALRLEREATEAEKKRVEFQRRKVEREKTIAIQQRSRAETAEKEVAEERQLRQEAYQRFEALVAENKQQVGEISWLRANNNKLQQQSHRSSSDAQQKLQDELHSVRAQFNELDQHYRMLQGDAAAREREKNDLQQKYIESKVEVGILKTELDKVAAKYSHDIRTVTQELNEDRLKATERYQGIIAQLEWNTKKMVEELLEKQTTSVGYDRGYEKYVTAAQRFKIRNDVQREHIARLEASLRAAAKKHSMYPNRPRLPTFECVGKSFWPWNRLPVHVKALIVEYLVTSLSSLSLGVVVCNLPARVSIPSPMQLARDPKEVVMPNLLEWISEEDASVLMGYCNVSLDFRARCIIAQARLRIMAKIPSGMRTIANSVWKGERRWEIQVPTSSVPEPLSTAAFQKAGPVRHVACTEPKASRLETPRINRMVHPKITSSPARALRPGFVEELRKIQKVTSRVDMKDPPASKVAAQKMIKNEPKGN